MKLKKKIVRKKKIQEQKEKNGKKNKMKYPEYSREALNVNLMFSVAARNYQVYFQVIKMIYS